jgi:hypothetical protein
VQHPSTALTRTARGLFAAALCALTLAALSPRSALAATEAAAPATEEAPPLVIADAVPAPQPRTFSARRVVVEPRAQQEYSPTGQPPLASRAPVPAAQALPERTAPASEPLSRDALETSVTAPAQPRATRGHLGLVVGASGLEQPVHAEVALRFASGFLSARFGGGLVPGAVGAAMLSAVGVNGGALTSWSAEAGLAVHPFGGSFFLGATAGHLSLSASAPTALGAVNISANTLYVTPRLGWMAVWDSGFMLGFEAGAQLPIGPNVIATGPTNVVAKAESLSRSIAALPLPTAALKLGFLL